MFSMPACPHRNAAPHSVDPAPEDDRPAVLALAHPALLGHRLPEREPVGRGVALARRKTLMPRYACPLTRLRGAPTLAQGWRHGTTPCSRSSTMRAGDDFVDVHGCLLVLADSLPPAPSLTGFAEGPGGEISAAARRAERQSEASGVTVTARGCFWGWLAGRLPQRRRGIRRSGRTLDGYPRYPLSGLHARVIRAEGGVRRPAACGARRWRSAPSRRRTAEPILGSAPRSSWRARAGAAGPLGQSAYRTRLMGLRGCDRAASAERGAGERDGDEGGGGTCSDSRRWSRDSSAC